MKQRIIVLGGNSPANAAWSKRLSDRFDDGFGSVALAYKHWQTGDPDIDFDVELARLVAYARTIEGSYTIVAKSAGVLLALKGITEGVLSPHGLVGIGLPITYAAHRNISIENLLAGTKIPMLFIQAAADPVGSYDEVAMLVGNRAEVREVEGVDHAYPDLDTIVQLAVAFIGGQSRDRH